jgi:hypothetical protein
MSVVLSGAAPAGADLISFHTDCVRIPPAAVAAGAPAGGHALRYFVTTDGDILSVNNVQITLHPDAQLFNDPAGDPLNANPPNPLLLPFFPALSVDSWITTPGQQTVRLGPDLPGDGTTTFGDTTNDGPVTNFQFAQLTIPMGVLLNFTGQISIVDSSGTNVFSQAFSIPLPLNFDDHFCIPEPAIPTLAGFALLGGASLRRRAGALDKHPLT